jgi:hypothetical protein
MQAIVTKYLGPTNVRGSRVKATCQARSKTLTWDDSLNSSANHTAAAKALASELGWHYGTWVAGGLPDGSTAWVCTVSAKWDDESFTLERPKVEA